MIRNSTLNVAKDVVLNIGQPARFIPANIDELTDVYLSDAANNTDASLTIDQLATVQHDGMMDREAKRLAQILKVTKNKWRNEGIFIARQIAEHTQAILEEIEKEHSKSMVVYYLPEIYQGPIITNMLGTVDGKLDLEFVNRTRGRIKFPEMPPIDEIKRRVVKSGLFSEDDIIDIVSQTSDESLIRVYNTFFGYGTDCEWINIGKDNTVYSGISFNPDAPLEIVIAISLVNWFLENIPDGTTISLLEYQRYFGDIGNSLRMIIRDTRYQVENYIKNELIVPAITSTGAETTIYVVGNVIDSLNEQGELPENVSEKIIDLSFIPDITQIYLYQLVNTELLEKGADFKRIADRDKDVNTFNFTKNAVIAAIDSYCRNNNIQFDPYSSDFQASISLNYYGAIIQFLRQTVYNNTYVSIYIKALNEIESRTQGLRIDEIEGRALVYLAAFVLEYAAKTEL